MASSVLYVEPNDTQWLDTQSFPRLCFLVDDKLSPTDAWAQASQKKVPSGANTLYLLPISIFINLYPAAKAGSPYLLNQWVVLSHKSFYAFDPAVDKTPSEPSVVPMWVPQSVNEVPMAIAYTKAQVSRHDYALIVLGRPMCPYCDQLMKALEPYKSTNLIIYGNTMKMKDADARTAFLNSILGETIQSVPKLYRVETSSWQVVPITFNTTPEWVKHLAAFLFWNKPTQK